MTSGCHAAWNCHTQGAGKSSIFRCLGGLWAIPHGKITKPGGAKASLNSVIFYLPQKPYQVLGTLPEQMTYPDVSAAQDLSAERLAEILGRVDLSYLMERESVLTKETNWEEELSLGEKQRLAIARLIHHKPQFAVLDECTSAVSSEMERRLYEICLQHQITYVTISHRPALQVCIPIVLSKTCTVIISFLYILPLTTCMRIAGVPRSDARHR